MFCVYLRIIKPNKFNIYILCIMRNLLRMLLLATLVVVASSAYSASFTVDGIAYTIVSAADKTVEVSSGSYTGDIVIPAKVTNSDTEYTVTKIGNSAFYYCYTITSISLPNTITSIGESAFEYCVRLQTITIPESVTTIGNGAFGYCNSLETLAIPKNVSSIASYLVYGCKSLKEIIVDEANANYTAVDGGLYSKDKTVLYGYPNARTTDVVIPDGVTTIYDGAFWDCTNILTIKVPESVTTLRPFCFYSCEKLKSIDLPSEITTVPQGAFYYCEALESVVVPDKVTEVGQTAFANCSSLKSVKLGSAVETIGMSAFMNSKNLSDLVLPASVKSLAMSSLRSTAIETITIPKKCTSIGSSVFMDCKNLKEILVESGNSKFSSLDGVLCNYQGWKIIAYPGGKGSEYVVPAGVTNIDAQAFYWTEGLEKLELGNDVTTIGESAVGDCSNLKSVILGDKVTSIRENAFSYCTSLAEIHCKMSTPVTVNANVFNKVPTSSCKLYVPQGTKSTYEAAAVWKNFSIVEESSALADNWVEAVKIATCDGKINIAGSTGMVEVYNVSGMKVYEGVDSQIELPRGNFYIVRTAGKTQKVFLK